MLLSEIGNDVEAAVVARREAHATTPSAAGFHRTPLLRDRGALDLLLAQTPRMLLLHLLPTLSLRAPSVRLPLCLAHVAMHGRHPTLALHGFTLGVLLTSSPPRCACLLLHSGVAAAAAGLPPLLQLLLMLVLPSSLLLLAQRLLLALLPTILLLLLLLRLLLLLSFLLDLLDIVLLKWPLRRSLLMFRLLQVPLMLLLLRLSVTSLLRGSIAAAASAQGRCNCTLLFAAMPLFLMSLLPLLLSTLAGLLLATLRMLLLSIRFSNDSLHLVRFAFRTPYLVGHHLPLQPGGGTLSYAGVQLSGPQLLDLASNPVQVPFRSR